MKRRSVPCCVALAVLIATAFASSATAAPGTGEFSCQASAVRVNALGVKVEPFVANKPDVPCRDDAKGLINPTDVLGVVRLSVLSARTFADPEGIPGTYAETEVVDAKLPVPGATSPLDGLPGLPGLPDLGGLLPGLPDLGGLLPGLPAIHAEVLNTKAGSYCDDGQVAFYSDSKVVNLTIGDQLIAIPDNKPYTLDLGIAKVYINELITTPNSVTRRALRINSALLALDVVLAESKANAEGNPCGPDNKPPTPPPHKKPACSDGKDNDKDGKTDKKDPGCHSDRNAKNKRSYKPNDNNERNRVSCTTSKKDGKKRTTCKRV